LISNYTTPTLSAQKLKDAVQKLVGLYPDVPAFGSPFNTGNQTFGLSPEWKRLSAISMHYSIPHKQNMVLDTLLIVGDLWFHSQRRAWMQAANKFGVKTFGYLFTDPGAPPISLPTVGPTAYDALGGENTDH
jgi:hypothetical protein